jgi:hypothetical protein
MAAEEKTLHNELQVYEQRKPEWLPNHLGEFVVIADTTVGGFYPDYESAFKGGVSKFGTQGNFLVKQIWAEEPVYLIH